MEPCRHMDARLVQFDWRLVSVLGSSTYSASPTTASEPSSMVLQLKLDVANSGVGEEYFQSSSSPRPPLLFSPPGMVTESGLTADASIVLELTSETLDQLILTLNTAIERNEVS
mmetsp:Transcript_21535/g.25030  ORF Transcript_21535/g.25030 Transcript_21535/m.25030 type:complete len:114 (-) Transcript_21535:22-363(-)